MWAEFATTIYPACPRKGEDDVWEWVWDGSRSFNTKSAYTWLQQFCQNQETGGKQEAVILKHFWKIKAPPKVLAFSWRVMKYRIPTKSNLQKRNIILDHELVRCGLCEVGVESVDHLFIQCNFAYSVWMEFYGWLGLSVLLPDTINDLYIQHKGLFRGKKVRKRGLVLWHTVVWTLWLERNTIIFNNGKFEMGRIMELIKSRSWAWLVANKDWKIQYVGWCINPLECLKYQS